MNGQISNSIDVKSRANPIQVRKRSQRAFKYPTHSNQASRKRIKAKVRGPQSGSGKQKIKNQVFLSTIFIKATVPQAAIPFFTP